MSTPASPVIESPQRDLLNALSALRVSKKYADLTITCNYKQWAVHRAIICSRSGFFDGACSNQFREANSGVIDLSEDDEEAVEQMIHYFYHLDYLNASTQQPTPSVFRHRARSDVRKNPPRKLDLSSIQDPLLAQAGAYAVKTSVSSVPCSPTTSNNDTSFPEGKVQCPRTPPLEPDEQSEYASSEDEDYNGPEPNLILHARVYALAEKYDIPSLKRLAQRKFEMAMACFYDSPEFAEAIEEVYCSTIDSDRGLRDVVLQAFANHPQLANTQDVFAVIKETPTLALELFKLERGIPV